MSDSYSSSSDLSEWSYPSPLSSFSDFSVFADDLKDSSKRIIPEKLRFSAQQLAAASASQHFPTFVNSMTQKCVKMHWACHVGWCLCRYQYQPLTPLHLLPITPLTDRVVGIASHSNALQSLYNKSASYSSEEKRSLRLLTEGASYSEANASD